MTRRREREAGFTLVELLVVIAIIGVLVALLLPAVQAAREAANRMSCGNNLKQLGIGIHNHHDTYKRLPPGGISDVAPVGTGGGWGMSWMVFILPFVEQGPLYDKLQFTGGSGYGITNNGAAMTNVIIPFYRCPSSPMSEASGSVPGGSNLMAVDYVGISGGVPGLIPNYTESRVSTGSGSAGCCGGGITSGGGTFVRGNARLKFASITDGLSNTLIVSEVGNFLTTVNGSKVDYRPSRTHGWGIGASVGSFANSPSDNRTFQMTTIRWAINDHKGKSLGGSTPGWPDGPTGNCGTHGVCDNTSMNHPLVSAHPGGVQGLLGDGSVRFIPESTPLAIAAALATRDDGTAATLP